MGFRYFDHCNQLVKPGSLVGVRGLDRMSEITECGQSRLHSQSEDGRRFRGAAAGADRPVEIKELKMDRHPEEFKDFPERICGDCQPPQHKLVMTWLSYTGFTRKRDRLLNFSTSHCPWTPATLGSLAAPQGKHYINVSVLRNYY
ncbi:unnamed protein product [Pleuronectes platessa]|uniref:Uncharacterized protein n=1 Tax=Pleuronectes platessa TaxID=8262 RepID=A0A9N7UEW5_PLEPL|nr:unnamed protein product [Pleuronectes platessa]